MSLQPFPLSRLQKSLLQACYVIILCQVSVLCVYCTLVFSQRYHLFVWSVFSPKLLYESTKTLLFTLSVVTVLCLMHFVTRVPRMNFEKTEWKQRTYFGWTRTNQQFRIISLRYVAHEKKYKYMEKELDENRGWSLYSALYVGCFCPAFPGFEAFFSYLIPRSLTDNVNKRFTTKHVFALLLT